MRPSLELASLACLPGATLAGDVAWGEPPRSGRLEVLVYWETSGKGDKDIGGLQRQSLEARGRDGRRRFEFKLPEAPWSASGTLVSVAWFVEARGDEDRDVSERVCFFLSGDGTEVKL